MFKRGYIVGIAFAFVVATSALGQEDEPQESPAAAAQDAAAEPADEVPSAVVGLDLPELIDGEAPDSDDPDTTEAEAPSQSYWPWLKDTPAQFIMMVATVFATAFSGGAAWLLFCTLRETRRIGRAEVRAYLHCSGGRLEVRDKGVWVFVDVANAGQSPALNVRMTATFADPTCGIVGNFAPQSPVGHGSCEPIPATETRNLDIGWTVPAIAQHWIDRIRQPVPFGMTGTLEWDDVFGEHFETLVFFTLDEPPFAGKPQPLRVARLRPRGIHTSNG